MPDLIPQRSGFVAGSWVEGEPFAVENPADESVVAQVAATPLPEIERAVLEARRSFDAGVWADVPVAERARVLRDFFGYVAAHAQALIATIVAEAGQPVSFAQRAQVGAGLAVANGTIDLFQRMSHEDVNSVPADELVRGRVAVSLRRHEPVGVVTAITPYNGAIVMALQKLAPALMAGNSVVLRPSPLTPISSLILGAAAEAAGLPAGVLSVVVEDGAAGAELLTSHPAVDMVSFTGSTAVGRSILAQAAPTVKRVALELGGKSAQIWLPDALDRVAQGAAQVVAMTAGQACVAATRMLVPVERKDEVVETVAKTYAALSVGPPSDPEAKLGPVISAAQRDRIAAHVERAVEAGGTVVTGGGRVPGFDRGYYVQPTVLDLPDNANPAAREEIFGPVIGILGYTDLDDAVRIANDSDYGLSGQVWGRDTAAATAVARRLRTGAVNVNTGAYSAYVESGGYKQSGLGRERGPEGIRSFQELKSILVGELR